MNEAANMTTWGSAFRIMAAKARAVLGGVVAGQRLRIGRVDERHGRAIQLGNHGSQVMADQAGGDHARRSSRQLELRRLMA